MSGNVSRPRVGVFVCRCGKDIGGVIDVPALVEYAKGIPGVVYAGEDNFACSTTGLEKIEDAIKNNNLERIVVAACTPRTHEVVFQSALERASLNKYLIEMANIREQCSWVHREEPEEATEKAKDLVRMAVAKASLLSPWEDPEVKQNPKVLVIGGGISGISSSLSLADLGFHVHLVEKQAELGGMLRNLYKLSPTMRDSSEVLEHMQKSVENNPNIEVHRSSTVKSIAGTIGSFDIEVESEGARKEAFNVGRVIVAIGSDILRPKGLYGYGRDERIITQFDLEEMLKNGGVGGVGTIVMIQCAGSRCDERPYCSRICCNTALKNAQILRELSRDMDVYIVYKDLQTYGIESSELELNTKRKGVKLIRYQDDKPPVVTPGEDSISVRVFSPTINEEMEFNADLVVLSTPLIPVEGAPEISEMLRLPLDDFGFFREVHQLSPLEFATEGVYVCGTARAPKDAVESISEGLGVGSKAAENRFSRRRGRGAAFAEIDEKKCSGCGICIELCPYNAIRKDELGISRADSSLCGGCGVCAASCPERAITIHNFTDDQLEAQVLAAVGRRSGK
jgi:heterodisulfide reductase subunit A